jgi:lysyl-tRNA synthetase class 2
MPEKFLEALRHMPRSAGIALGVDRLVMLFANKTSIDEVTAFTPEEV